MLFIHFPDGTLVREQELCREDLEAAQHRYAQDKKPETREEYRRELKRFADLIYQSLEA